MKSFRLGECAMNDAVGAGRMSDPSERTGGVVAAETAFVGISADERARETAVREKFASFWSAPEGEPRVVYDAFISACPLTDDVILQAVDETIVRGWWVRPEQAKPGQVILFLHGGGYVLGSALAYRGFVSQIVSRTRIPALVIDYPLAPEATLPAPPEAALAAWKWLIAQRFEQIAIVGDSAGGGLTLVTLAELIKHPLGATPVAGVAFSPWTDLAFTGSSMTDPTVVDPLISYEYLQDCARQYRGAVDSLDPLASPLFGDLRGLPPLLIQVGTDERLLDDSRQYADRATSAGVSVQLEVWEGMHHVFQLDVAHLDSSRAALDRTARFLRDAFEPGCSRRAPAPADPLIKDEFHGK
jgi:epsilon-lactone hydrolase